MGVELYWFGMGRNWIERSDIMYVLKDVTVFDLNNPNCKIKNSIQEICDMFVDGTVPVVQNIVFEEDEKFLKEYSKLIIGIIRNARVLNDTIIIGDISIKNDNIKLKGLLKNYETQGYFDKNEEYVVESIHGVEIE